MLREPVTRRMQADGYQVQILTRSLDRAVNRLGKSYELVAGDVDAPSSLEAALQGCDGVHINLDGGKDYDLERRGGVNVAGAAVKAGIKRITYLSGASVTEENCWYPGTKARFLAEKAIRESSIPYTIFNAGWFMESLSRLVHGERAFVIGRQPNATPWIAAEDYARMVVKAYAMPEAENKNLFILGAESYTLRQALERYCAIVHPGIKIMTLSFWVASLFAILGRREELKAALPFFHYCEHMQIKGSPVEANALLGAPTITLEEWSRQQARHARTS